MWREKSELSPSHGTAQVFKTIYERKEWKVMEGRGREGRGQREGEGKKREGVEGVEKRVRLISESIMFPC